MSLKNPFTFIFVALGFISVVHCNLQDDLGDCPPSLPRTPEVKTYNDVCLHFVKAKVSWNEANGLCRRKGGLLVQIDSQQEQDLIYNTVKSMEWRDIGVWIGATDHDHEGTWKWSDGSRLKYSRWHPGEGPAHGFLFSSAGYEDCALMRINDGGRWHDYDCGTVLYHHSYICQYSKVTPHTLPVVTTSQAPSSTTQPTTKSVPTHQQTTEATTRSTKVTTAQLTTKMTTKTTAPPTTQKPATKRPTTTMMPTSPTSQPVTTMKQPSTTTSTAPPTTQKPTTKRPTTTMMPTSPTSQPVTTMKQPSTTTSTAPPTTQKPTTKRPPTTTTPSSPRPSSTMMPTNPTSLPVTTMKQTPTTTSAPTTAKPTGIQIFVGTTKSPTRRREIGFGIAKAVVLDGSNDNKNNASTYITLAVGSGGLMAALATVAMLVIRRRRRRLLQQTIERGSDSKEFQIL